MNHDQVREIFTILDKAFTRKIRTPVIIKTSPPTIVDIINIWAESMDDIPYKLAERAARHLALHGSRYGSTFPTVAEFRELAHLIAKANPYPDKNRKTK